MPIDATTITERVDLLELIGRDTRLRKVASTRGGEYAGPCPFCGGRDRLRVQPRWRRWWCRGCLADDCWQDAIAHVQRRDGSDDFAEACRRLGASSSELDERFCAKSVATATVASKLGLRRVSELPLPEGLEPTEWWRARALGFLEACQAALWSRVGEWARAYLHGRGLWHETLRTWRVGFQPAERLYDLAERWGCHPISRTAGDRWCGSHAASCCPGWPTASCGISRSAPRRRTRTSDIGPSAVAIPGCTGPTRSAVSGPVLLLEAELCAQLVWQEAGDLAGTTSLGGCNRALSDHALKRLAACPAQLLAHDADPEGDKGAGRLAPRLPQPWRVRPPIGKDPTAYARGGGRVRDWLPSELERLHLRPPAREEEGRTNEALVP